MNYAINWLVAKDKKQQYRSRKVIESDTEEECKDEVNDLETRVEKKKMTHNRRICSNEETFAEYNDRAEL